MATDWKCRMDRLAMALAAPLAPITLPAPLAPLEPLEPIMQREPQWEGVDQSTLLRLQVQYLEHCLRIVMDEMVLQEAEQTAINVAECVLSE